MIENEKLDQVKNYVWGLIVGALIGGITMYVSLKWGW